MRATVAAVLISTGVFCAQEPEVREAFRVEKPMLEEYENLLIVHPLLVFVITSWNFARTEAELDVKIPTPLESKSLVGDVIVDLKRDGSVVMNRRAMNADELKETLSKIAKLYPDQAVVLRGDQDVNYKYIVDALDVCRAANIWNVAFATSKPE